MTPTYHWSIVIGRTNIICRQHMPPCKVICRNDCATYHSYKPSHGHMNVNKLPSTCFIALIGACYGQYLCPCKETLSFITFSKLFDKITMTGLSCEFWYVTPSCYRAHFLRLLCRSDCDLVANGNNVTVLETLNDYSQSLSAQLLHLKKISNVVKHEDAVMSFPTRKGKIFLIAFMNCFNIGQVSHLLFLSIKLFCL